MHIKFWLKSKIIKANLLFKLITPQSTPWWERRFPGGLWVLGRASVSSFVKSSLFGRISGTYTADTQELLPREQYPWQGREHLSSLGLEVPQTYWGQWQYVQHHGRIRIAWLIFAVVSSSWVTFSVVHIAWATLSSPPFSSSLFTLSSSLSAPASPCFISSLPWCSEDQ